MFKGPQAGKGSTEELSKLSAAGAQRLRGSGWSNNGGEVGMSRHWAPMEIWAWILRILASHWCALSRGVTRLTLHLSLQHKRQPSGGGRGRSWPGVQFRHIGLHMCPWPLALGSRLKKTVERVRVCLLTWRTVPTLSGRLVRVARKLRSQGATHILLKETRLPHYSPSRISCHMELWTFNSRHST